MEYQDELRREIQQRNRAIVNGALVRPPRSSAELASDEAANAAEIDRLEERRSFLFRQLADRHTDRLRADLSYDLEACTKSLDLAFAARRRLRVARDLFRGSLFA